MSVTNDTGFISPDRAAIPWQRILFALAVPLVLLALLFMFFSATRAAAFQPEQAPVQLPALVLTDTLLAPNAVDLGVQKIHSGAFTAGQTVTYTIIVSNTGSDIVTGPITVTDDLPDSTSFTPTAMGGSNWEGCDYQVSPAACVYSNTTGVQPGASLPPLILRGTLGQGATGTITNTATISNSLDTDPDNNISTDVATVVAPNQGADLAVAKRVTPSAPAEGETITYTVVLTNNGPNPAAGIILTDTLPTGLTFITATTTTGVYTTQGTWGITSLPVGSSASMQLVARVNVGTSGTITNTVSGVSSDQPDPDTSNNRVSVVTNLRTTRLVGVVSVQGSGVAIPAATIVMVDSTNRVFTTTTTASGHYTFTSTTSAPIQPGNARATAIKRGYRFKTATATLVAGTDNRLDFSLDPAVDLVAFKTDGRTTVAPGDTITYTIAITNFGTQVASGIVITDILPTNVTYVTDTLNITHTTSGTRLVWRLPSSRELQPNGTSASVLTFQLRGTVSASVSSGAVISNTVQAGASGLDGNPADNSFNDINTVSTTGAANLVVTKSVSPTSASINGTMVFTIRVTNSGSAAATNVSVTDQFPTYLAVTNQSTTQGTATLNSNTRTVTVSVGTINAGGSVTITITTRVNTSATTTLTLSNTATAQYTTSSGTQSRSGSVSFQVIGTSTLPGTGWGPPAPTPIQAEQPRPVSLLSILFMVLGLAAFGAAFLLKGLRRERALLVGIGVWMLLLGAVFSPAVRDWLRPIAAGPVPATAAAEAQETPVPTDEALTITWATPEVIETLPDYPIPTPAITSTPGEDPPDSTAIQRILIPALGLDTVVKYVPYDGYTWMIAGLRNEVAWMGDTSWPGLGGNTALAGHITLREGGNGPFRYLEELVAGDEVTLFTEQNIYKYRVRERQVVSQTDMSVVKPGDTKELTLITCTGWDADSRFYLERLVVSADLFDVEPIRIETHGLFFPQNQSH